MSRAELTPPLRALSALALMLFFVPRATAVKLPSGYTAVEYVTIPCTGAKPKDAVVLPNVVWKDVKKIYCRYATTCTTASSGHMLFSAAAWLFKADNTTPWLALTGTRASGSSIGLNSSGPGGTLVKTPGDAYNRDGSVHEFTITGLNTASTAYFQFGGAWQDVSWNGTTDWYELILYDADDLEIAHLIPCVDSSTEKAGFYDTKANAFRTKLLDSWDDFTAGPWLGYAFTVTGSPVDLGSSTPDYGSNAVDQDAPLDISLTGGVEVEGEQGLWFFSAAGDARAQYLNATFTGADGTPETITGTSFSRTITGNSSVQWNFDGALYRLVVRAATGGTVTVDGVTGTAITNWYPAGTAVQVSAPETLAGLQVFGGWGGLEGDHPAAMTLTMDAPREIYPVYMQVTPTIEIDSRAYITNGLIVHCDGKDNAGYGVHDDKAVKWTDLSGHGNDIVNAVTTDPEYVWGWNENGYTNLDYTANGVFTAGGNINTKFMPYIANLALDLRGLTFEADFNAACENNRSASKPTYASAYLFYIAGVGYSASEGTALRLDGNDTLQALGTAANAAASYSSSEIYNRPHSAVFEEFKTQNYQEGTGWKTWTGTSVSYASPFYEGPVYFLNRAGNGNYYRGELRTLRLYDRALNQWEAEWNCYVDMVRYHGAATDPTHVVHTYSCTPANYGTPETPYGTATLDDGAVVSYSAAPILVTSGDDGVRIADAASLGADIRARFLGWTLYCGNAVLSGPEERALVKLSNYRSWFAWNFERQVRVWARAAEGGQVCFAGGEAAATAFQWCKEDSALSVTVTAVPDAEHEFLCWGGDIGSADPTALAITVPTDKVRNLAASFVEKEHTPVKLTWKSSVRSGSFFDPGNWVEGAVPQEGDEICIDSAVAGNVVITIDVPTPRFGKFVVRNPQNNVNQKTTVKLKGWMTCLSADEIVVGDYGVIAADGPFYNEGPSNRVWLAGETLTVEKNGLITADNCGYTSLGYNGTTTGQGPAWFVTNARPHPNVPGVYGGVNGCNYGGYSAAVTMPYGSAECPTDPGSAGSVTWASAGGAIRLDFTGKATVDGLVTASSLSGNSNNGGCSGGSVWLTCSSLTGSGDIRANAKLCSVDTVAAAGLGGGAGRVAVHYDPVEQAAEPDCRVRIEALTCVYCDSYGGAYPTYGQDKGKLASTLNTASLESEDSVALHGLGTIWMTDDTLLKAASYRTGGGWKFGGWLVTPQPIDDLVFDEDAVFTNCQFYIDQPGLNVTFRKGVDVYGSGAYARREMGVVFSNATVTVDGNLTVAGARFGVRGGSLTLNGDVLQRKAAFSKDYGFLGGEIVVAAGPTNAPNAYGATLTVNGNWKICDGGVVRVECEKLNGAIVKTTVNGNLTLDEGGWINSDCAGYRFGPGSSRTTNPASSYGGRGAGGTWQKATYGNAKEPLDPGSGGGYPRSGSYLHGGGVVLLEVDGTLVLNGRITADANLTFSNQYATPGSGGSVNIRALKLVGNGAVSAAGGVSDGYGPKKSAEADLVNGYAAGGGGRIAIRTNPYCSNVAALKESLSVTAKGGMRWDYATSTFGIYDGEDGTVWWGNWGSGTMILVR